MNPIINIYYGCFAIKQPILCLITHCNGYDAGYSFVDCAPRLQAESNETPDRLRLKYSYIWAYCICKKGTMFIVRWPSAARTPVGIPSVRRPSYALLTAAER